jgi:hypothetical protein
MGRPDEILVCQKIKECLAKASGCHVNAIWKLFRLSRIVRIVCPGSSRIVWPLYVLSRMAIRLDSSWVACKWACLSLAVRRCPQAFISSQGAGVPVPQ